MPPMLKIANLKVIKADKLLLDIPSLEVQEGEILGLMGKNGAGKTTLLKVIALLENPSSGTIFFRNSLVERKLLLSLRRQLAVVFQDPLLLQGTVFHNVAAGLYYRGLSKHKVQEKVEYWLSRFGIAHLSGQNASLLSGGEARRVGLARAFALSPRMILLDEPFTSLDAPTRRNLLVEVAQIIREEGTGGLFVTHEFSELPYLADRVAVISGGKIIQQGTVTEIFHNPTSRLAAELTEVENIIPAVITRGINGSFQAVVEGGGKISLPFVTDLPVGAEGYLLARRRQLQVTGSPDNRDGSLKVVVEQVFPGAEEPVLLARWGKHLLWATGEKNLQPGSVVTVIPRPPGFSFVTR